MTTNFELKNKSDNTIKDDAGGAALIDIEFTGIDNSVVSDNEIIQVKILNVGNDESVIKNFNSNKDLSAYVQLEHKVIRYTDCPFFSMGELAQMLAQVGLTADSCFWGFGVDKDIEMLAKYGGFILIKDIRTHYQKTKFAYRMATEGSGLEPTYLIVTGQYPPNASHADISEMSLIKRLFDEMKEHHATAFITKVPFGHCSGMSVYDYVDNYRRQADGYRYNNSDEFAQALNNAIEETEYFGKFDDDDDDEF